MERFKFTRVARNKKVGPIPVTITTRNSCPDACPLKASGVCYAQSGPTRLWWDRTEKIGISLLELCQEIKKLPLGQLWRHNEAGDLPGDGDVLDLVALAAIVKANKGRNGFTYTHAYG